VLKAFLNAFRVPDLRNKILFTLFVIPSIYMLIARDHAKDRERETAVSATDP